AQGSLMGMQADLNNVATAADGAQEETNNLGGSLREMNRNIKFDALNKGIEGITGKLKSAAKAAWDFGQKMLTATLGAGEWADQLATEAAMYQVSPEDLQRMRYTARMIDTDVDAIIDARNRFKKNKATEGTEFMGIFADEDVFRGGYDIRAKNWEDAFWDTGEAIMAMSDAEEQEAYAQRAFGRGWHELIPLFSAGREEYEKMNASWHVVSDDNLKKLTDMDDQVQKISSNWETLQNTFLATLASTLTPLLEKLNTFLEKFNEYLESEEGQQKMEEFGNALSGLFDGLLELDPEAVMDAIKDAIDGIVAAFQWIDEHKGEIVQALKAIGEAFIGMKLLSFATNLAQIVANFWTLKAGGFFASGASTAAAAGTGTTATGGMTTMLPAVGKAVVGFALLYPTIHKIATDWGALSQMGKPWEPGYWDEYFKTGLSDKQFEDLMSVGDDLRKVGAMPSNMTVAKTAGSRFAFNVFDTGNGVYTPPAGDSGGHGFYPAAPVYEGGPFGREGLFGGRMNDLFAAGGFGKNSLTSDDISEFRGLPAMIQAAVRAGMQEATVYAIVPSEAVGEIGSQVGEAMWGSVMKFAH
ncbi:MAG: hypothetical protein II474_03105, partial [Firmicutes bacterium]|nr:hypothetical protein [Bacillota bacterium]